MKLLFLALMAASRLSAQTRQETRKSDEISVEERVRRLEQLPAVDKPTLASNDVAAPSAALPALNKPATARPD